MIGSIPVMFWPDLPIALALLIASSWFLTRHIGLALIVALSPLPGFVLAVFAMGDPPQSAGYLSGFLIAGFLAGIIAPMAARGPASTSVGAVLRDLWPVFVVGLLLFVPAALLGRAAFTSMASELSAILVTALGAMLLSYDENFVVRINRAGEARQRETERLEFLTKPRWGMSLGGIALVFSALGFFGAQKEIDIGARYIPFAALALVFIVGTFFVSRNVRRAFAALLAMAPATLLLIALSGRFAFSPMDLLLSLAAAVPVMLVTASAHGYERNRDSWQTTTQRGLDRFGPIIVVTTIASALASVLCGWPSDGIVGGAALLLGGVAALILQPALTTALYSLFPKRVSLEDAFRQR